MYIIMQIFMESAIKVDEAKDICQDHSQWQSIVSAYPYKNTGMIICMF